MNLSRCCRESVWIEILSRIYRLDKKFLDGSRSYRDKFQKARWIKIALTSIVKRRKRGSVNANLSRSCQAAIKWKPTLMDRESVEDLSARQKVSRWIEKLSRQSSEISMDRDCDNFYRDKKKKGLDR